MKRPILVIQMQRMGDLILSFPLFLWLRRAFPGHPLWVMAEPGFAEPLRRIGPEVRYLGYDQGARISAEKFHLVINLSHRAESMELAGRLQCEGLAGGFARDGVTRMTGEWQEYRASLSNNNRHNRFHWADLNALDVVPIHVMGGTRWPAARVMPPEVRKVGLFLGASEVDKRPSAGFWAGLVGELERRGYVPVLLGGPAEKPLCREVRALVGRPVAGACGTLGLEQFALLGQNLAAMITPDTGPMHLAAWTGLRVINLSMGPVHAWETGPYQPGHVVLRSSRDCVGCWRCSLDRPRCHDAFTPARTALVLEEVLRGGVARLGKLRLPGLEIYASGRRKGLYHLRPLSGRAKAGQAIGVYWQAFWLHAFGKGAEDACLGAAQSLREGHPALADGMTASALALFRSLARDPASVMDRWERAPSLCPLSGYCSTHLSNNDLSPESRRRALGLAEAHLHFLS